jgi:hypothetical protein
MVLGALLLALSAFSAFAAGKGENNGNQTHGCNQNKETPDHHYDADCDGSASENGNGGGGGNENGGGKPCAGCVGKADNKHPPGQDPDENDHNKGYECDDNKGVGSNRGSGNPAHTGCRDKTPSPTPSTPAPSPSTPGPTPSTPGPTPSTPGPTPSTPGPSPSTPGVSPTVTPSVLPTIIKDNPDGDIDGDGQPDDDVLGERPQSGGVLPFPGGADGSTVAFLVLISLGLFVGGFAAIRATE